MTDPVIRVEHLAKRYRLGHLEPYQTLRDTIARMAASSARALRPAFSRRPRTSPNPKPDGYIWALKDISFEVKRGEVLGVIGPNGSGKTTLLKILSRITEPTEGRAEIHGSVGSLLEVGTGFHFELTGRENVYLSGAILGMSKREIDEKFEEIVSFAEVGEFMETPVKRYSDGMRVRLGFSVAAHLEPDVIMIDEVLAVGDASFQRKCLGRMGEVRSEGRTVIFVSHDMAAIENLCDRAFALERGRIFASGNPSDVIARYLEGHSGHSTVPLASRTDRRGTGKLRFVGFRISSGINSTDTVQCGAQVDFEIFYEGKPPLRNVDVAILFYNQFETCVLLAGSGYVGKVFGEVPPEGKFVCRFSKFPLTPGAYHLTLGCDTNSTQADEIKDAATIHVVEGDYYGSGKLPPRGYGLFAVPHEWDVA